MAGYAAALVPAACYWYARTQVLAHALAAPVPFVDNPLIGASFLTSRVTAIKVIGKFLWLWLWPVHLSFDYSYNEIPVAVDLGGILALVVCLGLAGAAIWFWKRNRAVAFAVGFFFIAIAPTANIAVLIGSIMAERFLYLGSVGLAMAAVMGWRLLYPRYRQVAIAAAGVLLLGLAARTYARNEDWSDEQRFWRSGVAAAPGSFRPHILTAFRSLPLTPQNVDGIVADADRAVAILYGLPDSQNVAETYRDAGTIYRLVGDGAASRQLWEAWPERRARKPGTRNRSPPSSATRGSRTCAGKSTSG